MSETAPVPSWKPSKRLLVRFSSFVKYHPPGSVSRHLRSILLDYIHSRLDPGLPLDFHVWLEEMHALLELLDLAADEKC